MILRFKGVQIQWGLHVHVVHMYCIILENVTEKCKLQNVCVENFYLSRSADFALHVGLNEIIKSSN